MEQATVSEIVTAARNGSNEAYRTLIEVYGSGLLGYFYRNTGCQTEADDLVQETFLRLVRGLKNYKEEERFEVWLYRLAHNLLIDYWRKHKMVCAVDVSGDDDEWLMDSVSDEACHDPMTVLAGMETGDELQKALTRLSPDQRETILMRYFSGLSFEEIAKTSGVPLGTALARVHRGLKHLKKLLAKQEVVTAAKTDAEGTDHEKS